MHAMPSDIFSHEDGKSRWLRSYPSLSLSLYIIDADEKRVFLVGPIGAISGCISGEADW